MAGRKQHYIPQALQRGFRIIHRETAQVNGKMAQVYVFKKGLNHYRTSTEGAAAQRDFYSEPSNEESLDDKITIYERDVLAPAITALREAPTGHIDSHAAAAVVVHLSIRSAFIRGSFSAAATEMMEKFADAMRSDEAVRTLLEVDSLNSDSIFLKAIEEEILQQSGALAESGRNALIKLVQFRAREKFPQMVPDMAAMALQKHKMLLERLPEAVVSGHGKVLEMDLAPARRVERLKAMNWQIVEALPSSHFVLPDCLALGAKTEDFQEIGPYLLLSDDELKGVVMPISSCKALVGSVGKPELDIAELNQSFAKCSLDFFISSQADPQTVEAAQLIGSTVSKFVDNVVEEQTFAAPEKSCKDGDATKTADRVQELVKVPIKFEPLSRKSGKAQAAIRQLMNLPELQAGLRTVEAIVVSDNIAQSLRRRGVALNDHETQVVSRGTCHTVETPEGVSSQLFVTTESVNLVAKLNPLAHTAAAQIRHQAGRATYYATIATKIPKEILQRQRPLLETVCLRIAHFFCSHYFGGRLSEIGHISDEKFAATDSLYCQTLSRSVQGITAARLHFIEHQDADAALIQALWHVEQLLCATANVCATTCREIARWKASKSVEALQAISLVDWFELFALDLERLFQSRERLAGDNDLVILSSHIERVLWTFGIVLSTKVPEQIWMEALADEQLESMRLVLQS